MCVCAEESSWGVCVRNRAEKGSLVCVCVCARAVGLKRQFGGGGVGMHVCVCVCAKGLKQAVWCVCVQKC